MFCNSSFADWTKWFPDWIKCYLSTSRSHIPSCHVLEDLRWIFQPFVVVFSKQSDWKLFFSFKLHSWYKDVIIQGKAGCDAGQTDLVENVPACGRGLTRWPLKVPFNPNHSMNPSFRFFFSLLHFLLWPQLIISLDAIKCLKLLIILSSFVTLWFSSWHSWL